MHRAGFSPAILAQSPWTRGLRFFTVFDGSISNYAVPGIGEVHNLTTNSPLAPTAGTAGYPGQIFNGSNQDYVIWSQWDGKITGPVTVIARWKPLAGAIGSALGTWQNNFGFSLLFISGTFGAEDGVEFIVGETGTNLLISSGSHASFEGVEATVGGRYDDVTRTVDIWQNGAKLATNTDTGKAWNTTPTTDLASGIILGTSQWFNGNLYWIACFDRALTDAEMAVWTTQDPLDLITAEDEMLVSTSTITLANIGLGSSTISLTGPLSFTLSNTATAYAETGGDLPSVPPVTDMTLANVGVGSDVITLYPPILMTLANVGVGISSIDLSDIWRIANVGLGSSLFSSTIGGQPNVLIGNRYRR